MPFPGKPDDPDDATLAQAAPGTAGLRPLLKSLAERLSDTASVKRVYGEPVVVDDKTIIPVARVAYGFGGGMGRGQNQARAGQGEGAGGGGGVSATPIGVVEVTRERTRFVRFNNLRTWALAAGLGFALGALVTKRSSR